MTAPDREDQIALRHGVRLAARMVRAESVEPISFEPAELVLRSAGNLDSLAIRPLTRREPGPGEIEIEVRAAGLNFRDVLVGLGLYPGEGGPLGGECAGVIASVGDGVTEFRVGDEVVALASGSFRTHVVVSAELAAHKPSRLTFTDAAGLPVAFLTARQALFDLANLSGGERVLIHAAAGGVGLAAVQLARLAGAEVFATASRPKHDFLRSLGIQHVFDSRSDQFLDEVRNATHGEGVHVVLNSLTGERIAAGLQALVSGGRFVEIGKTDVWPVERVASLRTDVSYQVYALDLRTVGSPGEVGKALRGVLDEFGSGRLQPPPRHCFSLRDALRAFRFMARAKHTGKIVLVNEPPSASPRPDGTYLITGGLGGLGLAMARGLVARGAKTLLLLGRRPPSEAALKSLDEMERAGASLMVVQSDVAEYDSLGKVLAEAAASLPPLRGVIHAAGVLDDGVLAEQTWDRFERVLAPKVRGGWNLHQLTRDSALDFFVVFSSAASLLGPAGQGNYAAANACLDALAHHRRGLGLPALSINWGPWDQVGMTAGESRSWLDQGLDTVGVEEGVDLFFKLLRTEKAQVAVLPVRWPEFLARQAATGISPLYDRQQGPMTSVRAATPAAEPPLLGRLHQATATERKEVLKSYLIGEAARLLGSKAARSLEPSRPLQEVGLDSLMAVELRNVIGQAIGRSLPAAVLFNYPTVEALAEHLLREVLCLEEAPAASTSPASGGLLDQLEQLSDEEVERLLGERSART